MSGWTCVSCGKQSPEGTRFCGFCGTPAAAAPTVATWSCRMCGTANPEGNAFCGGCGARTQAARTEELRLVTALFADISGFTTLADTLDTESLHEVITPLVRGLSRIAERYEGFIEKFAGDAILVLYGAPVTHEDDAQRALLAALDMHAELPRLLAELPPEAAHLTIHIGVNTGRVIGRQVGSDQQSDYAVLGDSVILAQRLESACPAGETYVGPTTYELCKDEFDFESVGELTLKGKLKTVEGFRLLGPKARRAHVAVVGREREVQEVQEALERPVTALVGEPGAGKTRVLAEVRRRVERPWLATRCLSYGASLAYWPIADLLRTQLDGAAAEDVLPPEAVPGARRLLGIETGGTPEVARREVHDAVAVWLRATPGAVLAIEDVHWADSSTLDLLAELVRVDVPVSVLVTSRTTEPLVADAHVVEVGALDADAVRDVAAFVLDAPAAIGLVELLVDRTAGNALHVVELCRALAESGTLVRTVDGWDLRPGADLAAVPTGIERVYATRLDALPPSAASVLQLASVIGRSTPLALLRAVHDSGRLDEALATLFEARMLEQAGEAVTFSHALLQEVVYGRMLRKRRRELHARVAEAARRMYGDGDDTIGLLARHLYLADAGEEAVEPLLRAARRAQGLHANDEAAVHLERALEVLGSDPRVNQLRLELAGVQERRGAYEKALTLYRAGLDGGGAPARIGAAAVLSKTGHYDEALELLDTALQQDAAGDNALLRLARARVAFAAGRTVEALTAVRQGLHALTHDDEHLRTDLLLELVRIETDTGYPEFAVAHGRKLVALLEERARSIVLVQALRLLGDAERKVGALPEAVRTLTRAIELAHRLGYLEEAAASLLNVGMVHRERGDHAPALDVTRQALTIAERLGHSSGRASCLVNIADLLMLQGRLDEALEAAYTARDFAVRVKHLRTETVVTVTLAEIHLARGERPSARKWANDALRLAEQLAAPEYADMARRVLEEIEHPPSAVVD